MSATTRSQADPLVHPPSIPMTVDHLNPAPLRWISSSWSALPQRLERLLRESQVQALKYNNHHKQTHQMWNLYIRPATKIQLMTQMDLSKVLEDYSRSNNTKKLNLQLKKHWA